MIKKSNDILCKECAECECLHCLSVYMNGSVDLHCLNSNYGIRRDFFNNVCCCTGEPVLKISRKEGN